MYSLNVWAERIGINHGTLIYSFIPKKTFKNYTKFSIFHFLLVPCAYFTHQNV